MTIQDADGAVLATGAYPELSLEAARRIADERGHTVYLYSSPDDTPIAVRPTALEYPD